MNFSRYALAEGCLCSLPTRSDKYALFEDVTMSAGKKLINSVETVVEEYLSGLCLAYPHLEFHAKKKVILAPDWKDRDGKVSVMCGGGAGHEPFAAGFVGSGMLTAAIAGSVFAAPPSSNILYALQCVSTNNKGDCLNFGIAIEKARQAGLTVADLTVGEDCSIPTSEQGRAGRRGLVGIMFVQKVAGSLAERGRSLAEVARYTEIVANNIATYAVGLSVCSLPGQGPMFDLPQDEIEVGLGVHGEAGYKRLKLQNAAQVVSLMLNQIIQTLSIVSGDFVAVIVNNFGGSSQLEQGIVTNEVIKQLEEKGVEPVRVYFGVLMTSLDSAGIHISMLRLPEHSKAILIECLDDKTEAPCWPGRYYSKKPSKPKEPLIEEKRKRSPKIGRALTEQQDNLLKMCLKKACDAIMEKEDLINELDRGCGDGDCGTTHKELAKGILAALDSLPTSHPSSLLTELSMIAEERMGGTSGAVYSLLFTTAGTELSLAKSGEDWLETWAHAWRGGIDGIIRYSKARIGDRTMLDVLDPACKIFEENLSGFYEETVTMVIEGVWRACNETKNMEPRAGRASYVKQAIHLKDSDAGAYAVATWINAIGQVILSNR
ncbi:triokinase/FMN cyclase isoform X2 [Orussus abietinus]|uniref:triokinase/FMN cyclase isoform X2 n=1 Tax=Orussus abietinus TaxID=222816 RepID=UPI0006257CC5|nr:triokinase/FMN cyclase isoform X2 [Orussus abietinus]